MPNSEFLLTEYDFTDRTKFFPQYSTLQINKSNEISQIDLDFFLSSSCLADYLQRVTKHGGKALSINLFNIKRTQNTFHSAVAEIALQFKSGEIQVRNVFLKGKSVVIIPYFLSKAVFPFY